MVRFLHAHVCRGTLGEACVAMTSSQAVGAGDSCREEYSGHAVDYRGTVGMVLSAAHTAHQVRAWAGTKDTSMAQRRTLTTRHTPLPRGWITENAGGSYYAATQSAHKSCHHVHRATPTAAGNGCLPVNACLCF